MRDKLPEKWCITSTKENVEVIEDYFQQLKPSIGRDSSIGNHHCVDGHQYGGYMYFASYKKNGYDELTFEEFKILVLKETIQYEIY